MTARDVADAMEVENAGLVPGSAEARRDEIKSTLRSLVGLKERVLDLISEAQAADDHLTLGYPTWPAYVAAEFAGLLDELDREDRRIATFALAKTGMSSRAIAPIVGVSDRQVRTDLTQVGSDFPPGEAVPPAAAEQPRASSAHSRKFPRQQGDVPATPTPAPGLHLVTGLDGKRYSRRPSSDHLSTPQPPKYGNRRKHAQMLEALVTMLSGAATAFEEVTSLDVSVTKEEAIRLTADLALQVESLGRIANLLKERAR